MKKFFLKYQFDFEPPVYISDVNLEDFLSDHKFANDFAIDKWFGNDLNYDPLNSYVVSEFELDKDGDLIFLTLTEGKTRLHEQ